jgi:hypothetical protein
MADMLSELAERAGVSAEMAKKGLGALLAFLKGHLPAADFSKVAGAVPGADAMMSAAEAGEGESSGGLLGAAAAAVGKLFGGGAADLVAKLSGAGFSAEQAKSFLPAALEFLRGKLPANVAEKLAALIPAEAAAGK